MTEASNVTLFPPGLKFATDQDAETGRWFVVDTSPGRYRYPVGYATHGEAEAFMDRLNAAYEGEPASVIEDLRRDSDALRGQRLERLPEEEA